MKNTTNSELKLPESQETITILKIDRVRTEAEIVLDRCENSPLKAFTESDHVAA